MKIIFCDRNNHNELKDMIYQTIKKYDIEFIFISFEFSKLLKNLKITHDLDKGLVFTGKHLYNLISDDGENLCGIIISNHIPNDLCVFADSDGYSVINLKLQTN